MKSPTIAIPETCAIMRFINDEIPVGTFFTETN